jgi:predicted Zn-dependent protease
VAVPPAPPSQPRPPSRSQQRKLDRQAARQARFDEVAALHARGWSHSAIARSTGLDRATIRTWLQAGPSRNWGSGRHGQAGGGIGFSIEELAEPGAELAVDDGAADLEQEIGAAAGPGDR